MRRVLGAIATTILLSGSAVAASTSCVNPGGTGGCFATIQAAVDAAGRGTVIDVAAGTYFEHVVVPASAKLTVAGADAATTLVDGGGSGSVITLEGGLNTNVTLTRLGIRNGSRGIDVGLRVRLLLTDSVVAANVEGGGIGAQAKSNITVLRSTVSGNHNADSGGGISFESFGAAGSRLVIDSSTVSGNTARAGGGVASDGDVRISNSTIADNQATEFFGGGLSVNGLRMTGSTVRDNTALLGGGGVGGSPFNTRHQFVRIANSTISGNSTPGRGGGVGVVPSMRFDHVTIAGNSAGDTGGGLSRFGFRETVILKGSIVADNTAANGAADCFEVDVAAFNGNLIEDALDCPATLRGGGGLLTADPMLQPLQDNGGPTATQALAPGSPAIAVVTSGALCHQADQRGVARSVPCDLGAFEAP